MVTEQAVDRTAASFQGLLLGYRGRTGLTQRQLAERVGVSRGSVQDWEAGLSYPDAKHLQALIAAFLEAGGLMSGGEAAEAAALWAAAMHHAPRMQTPFDAVWCAGLLARRAGSAQRPGLPGQEAVAGEPCASRTSARRQDWGEAPDVLGFVGRAEELSTLGSWVLAERCRLVGVLGMGGIGKTILAARLAKDVEPAFQRVYWRSLRDALPTVEWLAGAIGFLSGQQLVPPTGEAGRLTMLLQLLRDRPSLLVLDNFETILEPGQRETRYRDGYAGYGRALQAIGEGRHRSCLVVTGREAPLELAVLGGSAIRTLQLGGLGVAEGQVLLADKQLLGNTEDWANLTDRFGGNGLALKLVGESIREVFGGDIGAFLDESGHEVFGGMRRLLAGQLERSSALEQTVLRVLAVEREPLTLAALIADLVPRVRRGAVLEAIEALRRRSLVERAEAAGASAFTLQSVVLEYVTDRLVEEVRDEIAGGRPVQLVAQPLIMAQAKDYVRDTQERLIGAPVLQQLQAEHGDDGAEQMLLALLAGWRSRPVAEQGFGPGNLVNLLRLVRGDLRGLDLSGLEIRQAYLQEVEAQDASLEKSHLSEVVLGEAFTHPTCVALSEDGTYLAAGTSTGEVCVWRVADRTLIGTLRGHTSMIFGVALSTNGSLLASAGYDGSVRLWDTRSGRPLATLAGHAGGAMSVALSQDGRVLASGGYDGSMKLWDVADGRLLTTVAAHSSGVRGIALSADGRLVATGSLDATVRLWEGHSGRLIATLRGHTSGVRGVALSADGQLVVSGSEDGTVRLWSYDEASGDAGPLATLEGHTGCVWSVALAQDGRTLASISEDGTVRLWDPANGLLLAALPGHTASWGVALSCDGRLVASSSFDGMVRLWDVPSRRVLATLEGHTGGAWGVAVRADGRIVASGSFDGTVQLWDTASGRLLESLKGHTGGVRGVALAANANVVASSSEDGSVRLWDTRNGRELRILRGHAGGVRCVALSQDGRLVASGSSDGTVLVWETHFGSPSAESGSVLQTLRGHRGGVWGVALSADGQLVASGSEDETVKLWDACSGHLLATLECDMGGVWGVALSEDGRRVASGSQDGTVRVWDTLTGGVVATLEGHTGGVWGVAISADGRLAASGTFDGTVRIWEVDSGRLTASLKGHTGGVWCVAMSGDGQLVASGSFDGSLRLWNGTTGMSLRTLVGDQRYERMDITGLTGITDAQRGVMRALGAVERL